jgi:DNA-binding CsgD family transcriptional regulator
MLAQGFSLNYPNANEFIDLRISASNNNEYLYWAVLENSVDGILVLTETGQPVYSNPIAQKICVQLNSDASNFNIPKEIWQILQVFISNHRSLPVQTALWTSEVWVSHSKMLRIRVRWLKSYGEDSYILINLEDCQQSSRDRAVTEAKQYGLTARETEVWLLRREGYSYREIAERLYVTIYTVKQHLKHIYAKEKAYLDLAE